MFMVLALYSGSLCNVGRKYLELVCLIGHLNAQTNKPSSKLYGSQMETTVTACGHYEREQTAGSKVHFSLVLPRAAHLLWVQSRLKMCEYISEIMFPLTSYSMKVSGCISEAHTNIILANFLSFLIC